MRFVNKAFNLEIELGEQERVYKAREGKEINMDIRVNSLQKLKYKEVKKKEK